MKVVKSPLRFQAYLVIILIAAMFLKMVDVGEPTPSPSRVHFVTLQGNRARQGIARRAAALTSAARHTSTLRQIPEGEGGRNRLSLSSHSGQWTQLLTLTNSQYQVPRPVSPKSNFIRPSYSSFGYQPTAESPPRGPPVYDLTYRLPEG